MRRIVYTLLLICITVPYIIAQKSVGEWNTYLAYYTTTKITEGNNHVYAVADGSLYSYNKEDNSITHYSRQTGLSDNDIDHIIFNPEVNTLLITYSNGNIDLLGENGVYNLSYLLDNSSVTNKTINNIYLYKEFAYLSTDFGIIVLNMNKKEVKDTYKLNKVIYSVAINNDHIYAASATGLIYASLDSNLLDYNEWSTYTLSSSEFDIDSISQICFFQNNLCLFANQNTKNKRGIYHQQADGTVRSLLKNDDLKDMVLQNNKLMSYTNSDLYIYSSLTDKDVVNVGIINNVTSLKSPNTFWIASGSNGIKGIQKKNNNYEVVLSNTNNDTEYPKRNYNYFMTTHENKLLVIGGGRWTDRSGRPGTFMEYEDGKWYNFDENEINKKFRYFWDYTGIAVDPKDPEHYFISSYGEGIAELKDKEAIQLYTYKNSALDTVVGNGLNPFDYTRIGGITFDKAGNLWATNCEVSKVLKVLKTDGTWASFKFNDFMNVRMADKITITSDNRKWINVPYGNESGILIFDDNGTIDDTNDDEHRYIKSFSDINGTIDASGYFCITEDKNGQVWIGTNRGPIYCANPKAKLEEIRCSRVIRPADEINDVPYNFLDGEQINAIAVDGGNRKWIATQSSGVFLVSEDGMETIENFTTTNSPLPSNQINSLAINQLTGEVFIGTEKGLVSYMGDATEGKEDYSDIYAYPNPVRPEHNDHVTIVGLMNDSNVKITDLKGNIIYQGKSAGGTFTWDCRSRKGGRVATGVYLVFSATPEAKESVVTKIMVVK
ncbi:two-component regulator propeller domain-containing protein [uncultured Parabacteroides sp.]|uniref:type IX secretion system anionic LPS delivery protein PorZ n=1 Tax=uncultured Parabacteroides sp. TaxID=512312 RepID=UPI0025E6D7B0|nr:two-component regulator propeller domain-containing protein [uncultured Parabacteroides sp.]